MKKQHIAVFCGSKSGRIPLYEEIAQKTGAQIGLQGRSLLFGGCDYGLMKTVSHAAYENGARVFSFRIRGLTDAYAPEIITADEQHFLGDFIDTAGRKSIISIYFTI